VESSQYYRNDIMLFLADMMYIMVSIFGIDLLIMDTNGNIETLDLGLDLKGIIIYDSGVYSPVIVTNPYKFIEMGELKQTNFET
jgi:hypothetical protein